MKIGLNLEVLNSKATKEIMRMIDEQFGIIHKFDFAFTKNSKDKIYVINRDVEKISFDKLRIDSAGLYLGTIQPDGFRPSIEGSQILGKLAKKNVVEINLEQKHEGMKGNDIDMPGEDTRIVLLKWKKDFVGSGKIKNEILLNAIPKSRRLIVVNEQLE